MNTKNKIMTILALASGGSLAIAMLNKYIRISATSKKLLADEESHCYKWRLGDIRYSKKGSGKPVLLIHDLSFSSGSYEWNLIMDKLSQTNTVFALDLLGCGGSEKPNLTYTNYLFVQLICDFIKSEIGHRTDVIATGNSAPLTVMACNNSAELFNRIMLINPSSPADCSLIPGKNAKLYKLILDLPIAGTLFYHIAASRTMIEETFRKKYFYNPYMVKAAFVDRYYEAAHTGAYPKSIFSSMESGYTKCNISNALKKIDNSIFIAGGSEEEEIENTIIEYKNLNSAVESSLIPETKHLPQLEDPARLLEIIHMFFS